jgi:hypothetical protein
MRGPGGAGVQVEQAAGLGGGDGISHIGQHSQKAAWRVVGGTAHQLSEVAYDRVNAGG